MLLSELARIWNFEEPNFGTPYILANAWINNAAKLRSKIQTKELASSMQLFAHLISLIERHAHIHTSKGKVISALV